MINFNVSGAGNVFVLYFVWGGVLEVVNGVILVGILESRSLEGELEKRSLEGKGKEGRNEKGMDLSKREWPYKWRIVNLRKKLQK